MTEKPIKITSNTRKCSPMVRSIRKSNINSKTDFTQSPLCSDFFFLALFASLTHQLMQMDFKKLLWKSKIHFAIEIEENANLSFSDVLERRKKEKKLYTKITNTGDIWLVNCQLKPSFGTHLSFGYIVNLFQNHLKGVQCHIQFSREIEEGEKLLLLDVLMSRRKTGTLGHRVY